MALGKMATWLAGKHRCANVIGLSRSKLSFLYESAATTETIGRYSFVGAGMQPCPSMLQCGGVAR